jgi:hypothetical protein
MSWLQTILLGVGVVACLVLLVQDLRGRWVHVVPVVVLWLAGLGYRWSMVGNEIWMDLAVTVVFLSLVLGLTWVVMKWRKPNVQLLNVGLGLGDILMFFALMGWFDAFGYLLFFVSGLILVLAGVVGLMSLGRWKPANTIPLAGLLGGYALVYAPIYWHFEDALAYWLYF